MRFRLLFGLSCCAFPSLSLLVYEFFKQALSTTIAPMDFVFPIFATCITFLAHIGIWRYANRAGGLQLTITRAENEDSKYFDQIIRMLTVSGALIGARFFLFNITPYAVLSDYFYLIIITTEFLLMAFLCALCARSLPFQANLFMLISKKQIWRCSVRMNEGRNFRVYIISDSKKLLQSKSPLILKEILPYELYSSFEE